MNSSNLTCGLGCEGESLNATDAESYIPHKERPETYIVPIVFTVIFIVGLIGNGLLTYFFAKYPHLRNSPNSYIVSLAVGDLMTVLFCVPFISTIYTTQSWMFGSIICRIQEMIKDLSIGVSVFTLTALSIERYFAISKPIINKTRTYQSTVIIIVVIWITAFTLSIPGAIFSHVRSFPIAGNSTIEVCSPFPEWLGDFYPKIIVGMKALFYYVIPLFIITVFYTLMSRHLFIATTAIPGEVEFQQNHRVVQIAERRKVAKLVLTFVFIFAICFMPKHIFMMWFYFNPKSKEEFNYFWNIFRIVGFCFGFINSCVNPIALYCISSTFNKLYNYHLFCKDYESPIINQPLTQSRFYSSATGFNNTRSVRINMSAMSSQDK